MLFFNLKDSSAVNTLTLFLCNTFFFLSSQRFYLYLLFSSFRISIASFRDSKCFRFCYRIYYLGAGIKVLMEMKWYITYWAVEAVYHRQLQHFFWLCVERDICTHTYTYTHTHIHLTLFRISHKRILSIHNFYIF